MLAPRCRNLARIGVASVLLALVIGSGHASAFQPVGTDFRISNVGTDTDAGRDGVSSAVAYNSTANEYLVVWSGDGLATNDELEIFGQRVNAGGVPDPQGDFRISDVDIDAARDAQSPAVAYNPTANEYLVVWRGDGLATNDEFEIFGQRVSATGVPDVQGDFRISDVGTDTVTAREAAEPAVAYNSVANQYLVTWRADGLATDEEFEIFGQRVSAAGVPDVQGDFRISNVGTDTVAARDGFSSAIAYDPVANEYLVVWHGDGLTTDDKFEVFGQRVSAAGVPDAQDDFRISQTGMDTDITRGATDAGVVYGSVPDEFLVTWSGDPLPTVDEFEIFGQRVSPIGGELGTQDFRISNVGTDGETFPSGVKPVVAYSSVSNEYLVIWDGDISPFVGEREIFGQRISATGSEVAVDFRISTVGTDGDFNRLPTDPAIAYSTVPNEYLATWTGDGLATNDELEIFGHRLAPSQPPGGGGGPPAASPSPTGKRAAALKKCKKKKGKARKACIKKAKKLPV